MAASSMQTMAGTLLVGDGTTTTAGSAPVYDGNGRLAQVFNPVSEINLIADPGNVVHAIPVTARGTVLLVTAGAETRTLAAPLGLGYTLLLNFETKVGNCVITVATTVDAAGDNTITFTAAGQSVELISVRTSTSAFRWAVRYNDGATIATV